MRRYCFGFSTAFGALVNGLCGGLEIKEPLSINDIFLLKFNRNRSLKTNKIYKKSASEFTELVPPMGACLVSDKITVDGELVDYMYRVAPSNDIDCGWRFFSGTETQEYVDNADNSAFYHVNTIANCDPAIIPYLHLPIGVELERVIGSDVFRIIDTN